MIRKTLLALSAALALSNAPGHEAFGQDTIRSKTNLIAEGGRESAFHLARYQRPIGQVTYTVWYRHPGGRYWYVYATTRNYGIALDVKLTLQRLGFEACIESDYN